MKSMVKLVRFKTLMKTLPFKYKNISPEEKYLSQKANPPEVKIEFFDDIKNLNQISCFQMRVINGEIQKFQLNELNILKINISEKFVGERGRINCSLRRKWFLEMVRNSICDS